MERNYLSHCSNQSFDMLTKFLQPCNMAGYSVSLISFLSFLNDCPSIQHNIVTIEMYVQRRLDAWPTLGSVIIEQQQLLLSDYCDGL